MQNKFELKSKLLQSGAVTAFKAKSKQDFKLLMYGEYQEISPVHIRILNALTKDELKECERINHAHLKRNLRLKKRIKSIFKFKDVKFITLTFTDEILAKTSQETRRKYVKRYLNSFACDYVANIDFGALNDREHYHAVLGYDILLTTPIWEYGFYKIQNVTICEKTDEKLAKYVSKLTNHAIKNTTKGYKIIYARPK